MALVCGKLLAGCGFSIDKIFSVIGVESQIKIDELR